MMRSAALGLTRRLSPEPLGGLAVSCVRSACGNHALRIDAAFVIRLRGGGGPENTGAALQAH